MPRTVKIILGKCVCKMKGKYKLVWPLLVNSERFEPYSLIFSNEAVPLLLVKA
jgi:hypothetical protein